MTAFAPIHTARELLAAGERVRIIAGDLQGHGATVVTDWREPDAFQVSRACVWVLTDLGYNPLPFHPDELERTS